MPQPQVILCEDIAIQRKWTRPLLFWHFKSAVCPLFSSTLPSYFPHSHDGSQQFVPLKAPDCPSSPAPHALWIFHPPCHYHFPLFFHSPTISSAQLNKAGDQEIGHEGKKFWEKKNNFRRMHSDDKRTIFSNTGDHNKKV